jgi:hypothetical protein
VEVGTELHDLVSSIKTYLTEIMGFCNDSDESADSNIIP